MDWKKQQAKDEKVRTATTNALRRIWGSSFQSNMRLIVDWLHYTYGSYGGFDAVLSSRRKGIKRGNDLSFLLAALEMAKAEVIEGASITLFHSGQVLKFRVTAVAT